MALDFDEFPLYDPLTKEQNEHMSNVWIANMSSFLDTLKGYLSQNGMFIPKVTTIQRNAIQSPQNGQMIYNTTTDQFQGFVGGATPAWKVFTVV